VDAPEPGKTTVRPPPPAMDATAPLPADEEAIEAGVGPSPAVAEAAVAPVYQGSPLCNAGPAPSPGDCLPDAPDAAPPVCAHVSDGGAYGYSGTDASALACHVAALGETAGQPTCVPAGSGVDGQACLWPVDCAAGFECVGAGTGTCRHYCCGGDSQCGSNEFCDIQSVVPFSWTSVPVCMPIVPTTHSCTLLDGLDCFPGSTCAVVKGDGKTSCVAVGKAKAGDPCNTDHCGDDLVCLGPEGSKTCYALCHTVGQNGVNECQGIGPAMMTCKGGLPLFPDPTYGICVSAPAASP